MYPGVFIVKGCSRQLSAHPSLPLGSTGSYFYLIWFSRHFCLTCLQVDLPINCLTSNLFTPSSSKWVRQPLFLTCPRARNIHTAMEFWEGGGGCQFKLRPTVGLNLKTHSAPNQSCAKNHPEPFGSHCSVSCFCIQCVGGWLVELLCVVSCLFWLESFYGLRLHWKLGMVFTCHYKTLKLYTVFLAGCSMLD